MFHRQWFGHRKLLFSILIRSKVSSLSFSRPDFTPMQPACTLPSYRPAKDYSKYDLQGMIFLSTRTDPREEM